MATHATCIRLHVSPGSRRPAVAGRHGDARKVRVTAAPERGRANAAVVRLVAEALGVARADVELVSGAGSREKVVLVHGLAAEGAESRLASAAGATR